MSIEINPRRTITYSLRYFTYVVLVSWLLFTRTYFHYFPVNKAIIQPIRKSEFDGLCDGGQVDGEARYRECQEVILVNEH
jgi:hypothetical protein